MVEDRRIDYVREIPWDDIRSLDPTQRVSHPLIDAESGVQHCNVNLVRTPAGGGSPEGLHFHAVDQVFHVLEGTLVLEIAGKEFEAPAGSLVALPAGTPHRNWNAGSIPSLHLAINAPAPDRTQPFATRVPGNALGGAGTKDV